MRVLTEWTVCETKMQCAGLVRTTSFNKLTEHEISNTHTQPFYGLFFRDHPGEPVAEENFWTLWCKGRLTEADTLTIRVDNTPSGLSSARLPQSSHFYRPDAVPAAQPTVSKH